MNDLQVILLKFRKNDTTFMRDIEQMFHQLKVSAKHQDYLKFIWYDKDGRCATYLKVNCLFIRGLIFPQHVQPTISVF